ncbi:glycosyltransferase family 2 protein [Aestuariirhabdus litorea]|uniref:Glycosyltransferase n=1 Tax=Aestuariirhabdus litorea TaxID=2528527 RepID=A0A3P3VSZ8_9GAMM|nr:glycosyltransferase [Aestuariirhabdus litorea]RRJ83893.1 glycosyltransferase [Aestuariirhabdus litorea]RWW97115.1 glycosyltransferase [Endozoicomonadaceae bacterium GTF-13]
MNNVFISIIIPCYNCEATIEQTVNSITSQVLPAGLELEIILVNDASTDRTLAILESFELNTAKVINLTRNQGRSAARNTGARHASGSHLLFIDSDCSPDEPTLLQQHLEALDSGCQICFGTLKNPNSSFLAEYQNTTFINRYFKQDLCHQTSAHFSITATAFAVSGGFPECYKHYGFEDRDFFLGLSTQINNDQIRFIPASVLHNDHLLISDLCSKLYEAARFSAMLFHSRHPAVYASSAYGKLDPRVNRGFLPRFARFISPLQPWLCKWVSPLLEIDWLPFTIRKILAQSVMALAYARGCFARQASTNPE